MRQQKQLNYCLIFAYFFIFLIFNSFNAIQGRFSDFPYFFFNNIIYILYIYMSNSKPGLQILWEQFLEWPSILVCCSTPKNESSWKFSASGVHPSPAIPLEVSKYAVFTHFQKFISRLPNDQFQFRDRHFQGFIFEFL